MNNCNDCQERVTNCGPISYAMCVRYEGSVRIGSPLEGFCELSVQDVIEDLYSLVEDSGNIYYNGDGILLDDNTFSLDLSKVRSSTWKPTWDDIEGNKPEQVNLIEGDNIKIEGIYPNLTISSEIESGISSISVEGSHQQEVSGNVDLKRATPQNFGVVKLGGNISSDSNGNINAPEYDRGQGIQKIHNAFSIDLENEGLGNIVGKIELTAGGLKVTYTNSTGSDYVLPDASTTIKGGVKLATDVRQTVEPTVATTVINRTYPIQKDENDALVVNIPWTDSNTEYALATDSISGLIKLGSSVQQEVPVVSPTAVVGKTYPVQLTSAGRAVVNVPWTEGAYNNGIGIDLVGNTFSTIFGTGSETSAEGNDSRILNGEEAYTWGDHREEGYLKSVQLATETTAGIRKIFSNSIQSVIPNSITNVDRRTYGVQVNNAGQMVVNVPWVEGSGGSYTGGSGISISSNVITNSSPNATHTGDVTGSSTLTISNNVVSNAKLGQMPAQTLKCNLLGTSSSPQDVGIEEMKAEMRLGCKHVLLQSLTSGIDTENFHQTSVFCNNSNMGAYSITIQDGLFDGQQLYLQFSAWIVDGRGEVELIGNLINFNLGSEDTIVSSLIKANVSDLFLFWSMEKNAWMTRINKD